jgi:hypothetical protein
MQAVSSSTVAAASSADPGTVQGAAATLVLRKALDAQQASAAQLIADLPKAPVGNLGTQVDTWA